MSLSDVIGVKGEENGVLVNIGKASDNKDFKKYVSTLGYLSYFVDQNSNIRGEFSTNGRFDLNKFNNYLDQHRDQAEELKKAYKTLDLFVKSYLYFEDAAHNRNISGVPPFRDSIAVTLEGVGSRIKDYNPIEYLVNELDMYLRQDEKVYYINKGIFATLNKMRSDAREGNTINNVYRLALFLKSYYDNNSGDPIKFLKETKEDIENRTKKSLKRDVEEDQAFKPYETKYSNGGEEVNVDEIIYNNDPQKPSIVKAVVVPLERIIDRWSEVEA